MLPTSHLVGFGLQQICETGGRTFSTFLSRHFQDHSKALPNAIKTANDRAWQVLGMALGGDSFLNRIGQFLSKNAEALAMRDQIRIYFNRSIDPYSEFDENFRQDCLNEWQQARKDGVFSLSTSEAQFFEVAESFKRYTDQQSLIEGSASAMQNVANELEGKYPKLACLLAKKVSNAVPLLAAAFLFFLRREIAKNQELTNELSFVHLQQLQSSEEMHFEQITKLLQSCEGKVNEILENIRGLQSGMLNIKATVDRLEEMNLSNASEVRTLFSDVLKRLDDLKMERGEVKPDHSLSIRNPEERHLVKKFLSRFRQLSRQEQEQLPALLNGIGKLQIGAGDFAGAERSFEEVAGNVSDTESKAEAHFNAYRALLEQRDWENALKEITQAAKLDRDRFAPFPFQRYQPKEILGAGGFGTAFLCHDNKREMKVVIKTIHTADLSRSLQEVRNEASTLIQLNDQAIIDLLDFDYMNNRPYMVMDYFPGMTLEDYVKRNGPLSLADLIEVAQEIARAMQSAHQKGVFHRDLKPANILVRKQEEKWTVKIIDFGLALHQDAVETSMAVHSHGETILSASVAGTMEYAPPEQMGKFPGIVVGPYSDVYSFGKTCFYALFKTTDPKSRHWKEKGISSPFQELLELCTESEITDRCTGFDEVLRRIKSEMVPAELNSQHLQSEGEKKLRALLEETYSGSNSQISTEDMKNAKAIFDQYELTKDRYQEIVNEVREQRSNQQQDLTARLDFAHRTLDQSHQQARKLANEYDYATAKMVLELIPKHLHHLRDTILLTHVNKCHQRVVSLEEEIRQGVETTRLESLRPIIEELLELQPNREDMLKLLAELPRPPEKFTNSLGMSFVLVPKGTFWMSEKGENAKNLVQIPQDFYMGAYLVTQTEWQTIMGANPSYFSRRGPGKNEVTHISNEDLQRFPVENVSWTDCREFLRRLNARELDLYWQYRLPTEEEWEYACRAGASSKEECSFDYYLNSPTIELLPQQANFNKDWWHPTKVGSYEPNSLGLYDMHGNVWEWCQESNGSLSRKIRGGSWIFQAERCKAASRYSWSDKADYDLGLRLVRVRVKG